MHIQTVRAPPPAHGAEFAQRVGRRVGRRIGRRVRAQTGWVTHGLRFWRRGAGCPHRAAGTPPEVTPRQPARPRPGGGADGYATHITSHMFKYMYSTLHCEHATAYSPNIRHTDSPHIPRIFATLLSSHIRIRRVFDDAYSLILNPMGSAGRRIGQQVWSGHTLSAGHAVLWAALMFANLPPPLTRRRIRCVLPCPLSVESV